MTFWNGAQYGACAMRGEMFGFGAVFDGGGAGGVEYG